MKIVLRFRMLYKKRAWLSFISIISY